MYAYIHTHHIYKSLEHMKNKRIDRVYFFFQNSPLSPEIKDGEFHPRKANSKIMKL